MANTYQLIASNTLTTTATSISFSAIPTTFTDLVVRAVVRSDFAGSGQLQVRIKLNSTSSGYSHTRITGNGTTAASARFSSGVHIELFQNNSAGDTANTFTPIEIYIPSYQASQNKPISIFDAHETNATTAYIEANASLWSNTAVISTITLATNIGNFVSGSSFFLYGIKNS